MKRQTEDNPPIFNEQLWAEVWDLLLLPGEDQTPSVVARNSTTPALAEKPGDDAPHEPAESFGPVT